MRHWLKLENVAGAVVSPSGEDDTCDSVGSPSFHLVNLPCHVPPTRVTNSMLRTTATLNAKGLRFLFYGWLSRQRIWMCAEDNCTRKVVGLLHLYSIHGTPMLAAISVLSFRGCNRVAFEAGFNSKSLDTVRGGERVCGYYKSTRCVTQGPLREGKAFSS